MNYFYHIATTVLGLSLILVKKILCHQKKKKKKDKCIKKIKEDTTLLHPVFQMCDYSI